MARVGWEKLMSVKSKNGTCQLLDRFTSITDIDMKAVKKSRTLDEINSLKNMYIVTWRSIRSDVKHEMNVNRGGTGCDG